MGSTRRFVPALAPLLSALVLSASAEAPVPAGIPPADETLAEALAQTARGLSFSSDPDRDPDARAAFEAAIRLDPEARAPYRLLMRSLAGPGRVRERAALRLREARAFGTRADWRKALSAGVAAGDEAVVREAVAALSAAARAGAATPDSSADLGAAALALCRIGEGADAAVPFRRYLARAARPGLVPAADALRTFDACFAAVARAPAASPGDRVRAAETLLAAFLAAPPPASAPRRAAALVHAGGAFARSEDPAARALFRRMALEGLRLSPCDAPAALFLVFADAGAAPPSLADSLAKIDAFAARPEAAGLGYSFALARAAAAAARADGADAALATNELARAESLWREERPGEPLPEEHAAFRLELMLGLGLGAGELEAAVAALPDDLRGLDPVFANNLAYTLACEGGDLELATRLADRSLAQRPDSPEALDTLGWILHLQGEEEEALELLLRSMKGLDAKDPGSAEVFDHLGDVLDALGRGVEAAAAWRHALQLDPTDARRAKLRGRGLLPEEP